MDIIKVVRLKLSKYLHFKCISLIVSYHTSANLNRFTLGLESTLHSCVTHLLEMFALHFRNQLPLVTSFGGKFKTKASTSGPFAIIDVNRFLSVDLECFPKRRVGWCVTLKQRIIFLISCHLKIFYRGRFIFATPIILPPGFANLQYVFIYIHNYSWMLIFSIMIIKTSLW